MMKLYRAGYASYMYYTVAKDEAEAIHNVQTKYNMHALPVVAESVDNIDGYSIIAVSDNKSVDEALEQAKEDIIEVKKKDDIEVKKKAKR